MARPGYTNLAPSPERDRLFSEIAATQGMSASVHKHRVEMIDQALRRYAEQIEREETMNSKIYHTPVATLKAAQKKLGGRITTYDGAQVLTVTGSGVSGAVCDTHYSPAEAAQAAGLRYEPVDLEDAGDPVTACGCGWDGKVQPGAHGQRCPVCDESLT